MGWMGGETGRTGAKTIVKKGRKHEGGGVDGGGYRCDQPLKTLFVLNPGCTSRIASVSHTFERVSLLRVQAEFFFGSCQPAAEV